MAERVLAAAAGGYRQGRHRPCGPLGVAWPGCARSRRNRPAASRIVPHDPRHGTCRTVRPGHVAGARCRRRHQQSLALGQCPARSRRHRAGRAGPVWPCRSVGRDGDAGHARAVHPGRARCLCHGGGGSHAADDHGAWFGVRCRGRRRLVWCPDNIGPFRSGGSDRPAFGGRTGSSAVWCARRAPRRIAVAGLWCRPRRTAVGQCRRIGRWPSRGRHWFTCNRRRDDAADDRVHCRPLDAVAERAGSGKCPCACFG